LEESADEATASKLARVDRLAEDKEEANQDDKRYGTSKV
jgi:hypothetical protein